MPEYPIVELNWEYNTPIDKRFEVTRSGDYILNDLEGEPEYL